VLQGQTAFAGRECFKKLADLLVDQPGLGNGAADLLEQDCAVAAAEPVGLDLDRALAQSELGRDPRV
jgi:hypothetical protein